MIRAAAQRDIENAQDWYLGHAPEHVTRFVDQLSAAIARFRARPYAFPTLRQDARRATLRVFPYEVWYRVHDELQLIEVLALVHDRQDPERFGDRVL
ncbi:MAG: type II toxin-antitoxin system RelE/ParE family toxin [Pseudolysinimonas sp.]|uniref:type II toxin-antitoxin system RelE/ParE family toxin n=1 Tax=Pseudolysinimonas sp. TaxID=2680009 RepID=UPI003C75F43C